MLQVQPSQFKLSDDGKILFQKDASNPLPGEPVARIKKGVSALSPEVDVLKPDAPDRVTVRDQTQAWLKAHIAEVLGPLMGLENVDDLQGPARGICFQVFEAMGIVPRENLEDLIAGLDAPMRQSLRNKQVRLGPILVFVPALNKPAAVRLRAVLWSVWNDKTLPASPPPDGAVSIKAPEKADPKFYQAIGYPLYGPRVIRIDMLDRVINAIYEGAKEGKFRAEHKMAEWLGCSIEDLYAVLEAMGHKKMEEPKPVEEAKVEESAAAPVAEEPKAEAPVEVKPEIKPEAKPELAQFRLKKGKAFEKPKYSGGKKPEGEKKKFHKKDKPRRDEPREPKVMSAGKAARPEDSPFAALAQLKVKKDASGS